MQNLPALRQSCSLLVGCVFAAAPLSSVADAPAQNVTLDVTFKLTDPDYRPLAGVPVRIVFGTEKDWQSKDAGRKIITDAKGVARFTAPVTLARRAMKKPTNFVSSLVNVPQPVDSLRVGAEM